MGPYTASGHADQMRKNLFGVVIFTQDDIADSQERTRTIVLRDIRQRI